MRCLICALCIPLVLIFFACDKREETTDDTAGKKDYRDSFVGQYQVHERISSYGFPQCGGPYSHERDTIISVRYGDTDSTLNVLGRQVYLDSSGYYYAYHYSLRLWDDSISSYFMNGGLGCGQNENYEGYKISETP